MYIVSSHMSSPCTAGPAVFPAAYDPAGASPLQADNLTPAQRCVAARVSHTEDKIGRLFYTRERSSMAVLTFVSDKLGYFALVALKSQSLRICCPSAGQVLKQRTLCHTKDFSGLVTRQIWPARLGLGPFLAVLTHRPKCRGHRPIPRSNT